MSATGQPNNPTVRKVYLSGASADVTTWIAGGAMADWVLIEGVGTTVLVDESGNPSSLVTDSTAPCKSLPGPWTKFTSTTASRVTMGNGGEPPPLGVPATAVAATSSAIGAVALSGGLGGNAAAPTLQFGSGLGSGVVPAANVQQFADATTIYATGFTASANAINVFQFQVTGLNITLPAVTAAIAGQQLMLYNNGTGATAVLAVLGSGAGNTVVSGTWPTSLKGQRYTASSLLGGWIVD
jgi:hypothetical protein